MKRRLTVCSGILILAVILATSCSEIERMSDYNEIKSFEIISHAPSLMELSGAHIEDDVIYIGIDFGEYLFPLKFQAKPVFDAKIDRIVGIDFSKELVLESPETELVFYVMASSGLSRPYVIRTKVAPLDKNFALSRFFTVKGKEPGMLISEEGVITSFTEGGVRKDTLKIFTVDGSFPVSITPEFAIAEVSKFGNITGPDRQTRPFVNGSTPLIFNNAESTHQLEIISQSGLKNVWNIVVCHAPIVSGADGKSTPEQRAATDINPHTVSATAQGSASFNVDEFFVDNNNDHISLVIKNESDKIVFPLEVRLQFNVLNGIQVLEWDSNETVTFKGWDDTITFYLLDTEACVSRQWKIGLKEWFMSGNDVLVFTYDYTPYEIIISQAQTGTDHTRGPAIVLDKTRTVIYPERGHINLCMTAVNDVDTGLSGAGADDWQLVLNNLQISVSEGATCEPLPAFEWRGSGSWTRPIPFKVTAQNGTEKTWHVNISDMRSHTQSNECELLGVSITRYTPNYAGFDAITPVTIDADQRTVTLNLVADQGIYPLRVWVQCDMSPFASITSQNGGNDPLVFENINAGQTITITAEDGKTTSDWTVKLQPPSHETDASVETFRITSISQGAQLGLTTKNDETGIIRLWLNAATVFPLEASYTMTVSGKATASIPLRGTLTFNSYKDTHSFTVRAEDGTTSNWNVRLVYKPQLPNWNLDEWRNGEPVSWGTSNSASTGTSQTAGNSGSAAQLRTGSILGLITSGSLFLGEFNRNNRPITDGMTDPTSLTFFGVPLSTSGKILGIQADVTYSPGKEFISGDNRELGSCVIELIKPKPGSENDLLRYHGANANGVFHALNNAEPVAQAKARIGNAPGTAWDNTKITVVSNSKWTTIQVLFDYPNGEMPDFTHLHVVFASSAQGDAFRGVGGSTLKVDNVIILYAEEE